MKKVHCLVFGHDFKISRDVTQHVKEFTCKNCKKQLTTNSNGKLIVMTPKFKEINDVLESIHYKRLTKKSKQISKRELLVFSH